MFLSILLMVIPKGIHCFSIRKEKRSVGDAGYRSRYLSHAKRALYHLSYTPAVSEGHSMLYKIYLSPT